MIDLRDPKTYRALNNNNSRFVNRLTVFRDGDVRIEEIHEWNKNMVSRAEFEGDAMSMQLPSKILKRELSDLATKFIPLADNWDFVGVQEAVIEFRLEKGMRV